MSDGVTNPHDPATGGFAEEKGKGKAAERVHDNAQMDDDDDDDDDEDEDEDDEDFEGEVSALMIPCRARNNEMLTSSAERRRYDLASHHCATSITS